MDWQTFAALPVGYKAEDSRWSGGVLFVQINWFGSGTSAKGSVLPSPQGLFCRLLITSGGIYSHVSEDFGIFSITVCQAGETPDLW